MDSGALAGSSNAEGEPQSLGPANLLDTSVLADRGKVFDLFRSACCQSLIRPTHSLLLTKESPARDMHERFVKTAHAMAGGIRLDLPLL